MAFKLKTGLSEIPIADTSPKIDYHAFSKNAIIDGYPDFESRDYFLDEVAKRMNTVAVAGDSILDYGCGTGELSKYFPDDIGYLGIDSVPIKILVGTEVHGNVNRKFENRYWTDIEFIENTKPTTWGVNINGLSVGSDLKDSPTKDLKNCIQIMLSCSKKGVMLLAPFSDTGSTYIDSGGKVLFSGGDIMTAAHDAYLELYKNTSFEHLSFEVINDGEVFILFIQKEK